MFTPRGLFQSCNYYKESLEQSSEVRKSPPVNEVEKLQGSNHYQKYTNADIPSAAFNNSESLSLRISGCCALLKSALPLIAMQGCRLSTNDSPVCTREVPQQNGNVPCTDQLTFSRQALAQGFAQIRASLVGCKPCKEWVDH